MEAHLLNGLKLWIRWFEKLNLLRLCIYRLHLVTAIGVPVSGIAWRITTIY